MIAAANHHGLRPSGTDTGCGLRRPRSNCRVSYKRVAASAELTFHTVVLATNVSSELREILSLALPGPVECRWGAAVQFEKFTRVSLEYRGDDDQWIPAYLFLPQGVRPSGGVVVFHQHNSEFHFGKSEVSGEAGDELQAFGPALAERGVAVVAPDAVSFEDRRSGARGTQPTEGDWLQHYNAMAYRLVQGDLLMRKCIDDAQRALTVLIDQSGVDAERVGVSGHSFGGTTALYHAALDDRCQFACVSGAACSFAKRQATGTGIGMIEVVPSIAARYEVSDIIRATSPAELLVVSTEEDPYSSDADVMVATAARTEGVTQYRGTGGHALDRSRFNTMVDWIVARCVARS